MSVSVAVGKYDCPAVTGTDAVTSLAFRPMALIHTYNMRTTSGSLADSTFGVGFAVDSGTNIYQAGVSGSSQNGVTITNTWRAGSNAKAIYLINQTGVLVLSAALSATAANGFTYNWGSVTSGADIGYMAIGGLDNVYVGTGIVPTSPSTLSITTPGFQPDIVGIIGTSLVSDESNVAGDVKISLGWSTTPSEQMVTSWQSANAAGTAATHAAQFTDSILHIHAASTQVRAALAAMTGTGFDLSFSAISGGGVYRFYFICMKGGSWKVSQFNQSTSTGNQSITGIGFAPLGQLYQSANNATNAGIVNNARISLGMAQNSSNRIAIFGGDQHGVGTTISSTDSDTTKTLKLMVEAGASPTTSAAFDLVTLDVDGMTENNTTVDATARQIGVLSVGAAGSGQPTGGRGKYIPGSCGSATVGGIATF